MIYGILLCVIFILYLMTKHTTLKKKSAIIIIAILLIAVAGLRSPELGMNDTLTGYLPAWHIAIKASWKEIMTYYVGNAQSGLKDVGFAAYLKLLSYISTSDQFFLVMSVAPYITAISILIYKKSNNFFMSYFLYMGLNLYTCSYYLLRHIMAATFIMIAMDALYKKEKWKFLIWVMIASTFHASAAIYLVAYPLVWTRESVNLKKKLGKWLFPIALSLVAVFAIVAKSAIWSLLSLITKGSRFEESGGAEGGLGRFILAIVIFAICIYETRGKELKTDENRVNFVLSLCTCGLYALMPVMADFHRFAKYFEVVNVIWLPNAVKKERNVKIRWLAKLGIYGVIGAYMFLKLLPGTNVVPYSFFWTYY